MTTKQLLSTAAFLCLTANACHDIPHMVEIEFEQYHNWHLSEGEIKEYPTVGYSDGIELIGKRVVITRRLEHLDPEKDAPPLEPYHHSAFFTVPQMTIVGKAEKGVSLTLVVEEFAANDIESDSETEDDTDEENGPFDSETTDSVSKVAPLGTLVLSKHSLPFKLSDNWTEVSVELPILPYDPEIEGYQVHISIVKKGKGRAMFSSGLITNEGKLIEDQ